MSLYDQLGVRRYINAAATLTLFGGSVMPEEVAEAMTEASKSYVDIVELQEKAGNYIADLTHNEAAFISNGATSGILLATAAVLAGDDERLREQLPFAEAPHNEVVIARAGRVEYDYAIRLAGGRLVTYGNEGGGTAEQLEQAITEKTAAIFLFYFDQHVSSLPSLHAQVQIARAHRIPLLVDAAAQLPSKDNLWRLTKAGADLVIFSGGKGLRGPQSSGLIVGRRKLIERVRSIASPHPGLGRPMKVGKEEIAGLTAAVKRYMELDEDALLASYERQAELVIAAFRGDPAVQVSRGFPSEAGQPMPLAILTPRSDVLKSDAAGIAAQLASGEPAVLVLCRGDQLLINPQPLLDGEIDVVIARLRATLDANRRFGG